MVSKRFPSVITDGLKKNLLFLAFSVLFANPKKLLYAVVNSAHHGLLNREKRIKKKSGSTVAVVFVCFLPIHSGHQVRWTPPSGN